MTTLHPSIVSRRIGRWLTAGLTASLLLIAVPLFGQGANGALTGTVIENSSGKYLEGAEVSAQGTELRTTTARNGSFSFNNLPAGAQTIVVNYPGLEIKTESVTIVAGQSATLTLRLANAELLKLGELRVSGTKEGMAQALALQKLSVETKLVAASDQFGPVSEGNVGEYLKFLPGVTIDYNVNDARGISLRGLSTAFTIVAVDGTPMAGTSSMDDSRRFEFEQIAMNNVETTELYKTVSPDIPASSTGGFVNFVTKSAFDSEAVQRFSYDASLSAPSTNVSLSKEGGVWGHNKEYTIRPSLDVNYSRRVNAKFGFNVNYRLSEKYDDSPRTTAAFYLTSSLLTPAGTPTFPTVFTTQPVLATYAITSEEKLTHREAFATKLDYLINDSTKLSISGQWNWYDLHFTQRGPRFALGGPGNAGVVNSAGVITTPPVYGAGTANGDSYTSRSDLTGAQASHIDNIFLYRNKYGTTWHLNGTLSHEFSPTSKASVTTYYSRADGQYRDVTKGFISSTQVMAPGASTYGSFKISGITGEMPTIALLSTTGTPVSLDLVRSLGNYTFSNAASGNASNFQSRPFSALDTKTGVNGNYTYALDQSAVPVKFETGFASDYVRRYIKRQVIQGAIPATTGAALQALIDPNYTRDVAFGFGSYQAVDPFKIYDAYQANLGRVFMDDVREFTEKNNALFLRADANVSRDLLLTGGLRWEKHTIDATAQSRANARSKLSTVDLDYAEWYPSLSLKYTPRANRNLVVRSGVSRTIGHPDYIDILPTIISETSPGSADGTIGVPSPNLKPYFSTNYDLSADYYFKHSGVVGVYAYRKEVKNYFTPRGMTAADIAAIAADYGYNPAEFSSGTVTENGSKSTIEGIELSFAQNLTFLPKPFDGFNVQANFTYLHVDSNDLETKYSQLRAVSPKTANFILGYRHRNLSITSTTNWVSESLFGGFVASSYFTGTTGTALLPDTRLLNYRDEKATTAVKIEYSLNQHMAVYFLVRNVFNSQRIDYYQGLLPQNQKVVLPFNRYEFGEPHLTLGVRGRF